MDTQIKEESPEDFYCRCCFAMSPNNFTSLTDDLMTLIRELLFDINFSEGSKLICEQCQDLICTFSRFKSDIVDKQNQFTLLVFNNEHNDVRNIQNLTESFDDFLRSEVLVKVEPLDLDSMMSSSLSPDVPKKIRKKRVLRNPAVKKKKNFCIECNKSFTDILLHQIRTHDLEHLFECEQCPFKTFDMKEFQCHKKINHKPKKYKDDAAICPYCALVVKSCLDDHIANIHKQEKHFFCDLCSFSAYRKLSLEYHVLHNHCSEKSFSCSQCNFATIAKNRLKNHIRNMHMDSSEIFICKYAECNKKFKKKDNLKYHVERCHEGENKFPCEYPGCDKSFYTRQERKSHFGNLHGPKNIICELCGSSYSSTAMLKKHIAHTHNECKYSCPHCSMKYRTSYRLKDHIKRSHEFVKDFKCEQCGEEFYRKRGLDHHIASKHLGIRYHCGVIGCNSTLSRKDAYITHLRSHSSLTEDEKKNLMEKLEQFVKANNLPK